MRSVNLFLILGSLWSGCLLAGYQKSLSDHWALVGEGVYFMRNKESNTTLADNPNKLRRCGHCNDFDVLSTRDVINDDNWVAGYRTSLSYMPNLQWSLEAKFLYLFEWKGTGHVTSSHDLQYPFRDLSSLTDYQQADRVKAHYTGQFWDAELNYWNNMTPRWSDYFSFSFLAGLRYFHLNEGLTDHFTRDADTQIATEETSHFNIQTVNRIGGVQVGANLQVNPMSYMSWEVNGKIGFMETHAAGDLEIKDKGDTQILTHTRKSKWQAGVFGDVNVLLEFIFLKHFEVHVGYEYLILSGVSTARGQLPKKAIENNEPLNSNGTLAIQGVVAGIGASF